MPPSTLCIWRLAAASGQAWPDPWLGVAVRRRSAGGRHFDRTACCSDIAGVGYGSRICIPCGEHAAMGGVLRSHEGAAAVALWPGMALNHAEGAQKCGPTAGWGLAGWHRRGFYGDPGAGPLRRNRPRAPPHPARRSRADPLPTPQAGHFAGLPHPTPLRRTAKGERPFLHAYGISTPVNTSTPMGDSTAQASSVSSSISRVVTRKVTLGALVTLQPSAKYRPRDCSRMRC